jgi:hypothetical protein
VKKGGSMSNAKVLMKTMEVRYGKEFVRDIQASCEFTDDDYNNVILIFKAAIFSLNRFCAVKQSTLKALRVFNPTLEGVRISDDSELLIGDSYFHKVKSEIDAMKQIVQNL